MTDGKFCTKCGVWKKWDEFRRCPVTAVRDGRRSHCKACMKESFNAWRIKNKDRLRKTKAAWRKKNQEKINAQKRVKWKANIERSRASSRRAHQKQRSTIRGRLNTIISNGIRISLVRGQKGGHKWERLVGYTVRDLICDMERKFKPGMSWDNYGFRGWHIDHKIPISAFNFTSPSDLDFQKCWSLKNLQPMWWKDNLSKNDSLDRPFQPSLAINMGGQAFRQTMEGMGR